MDENKLNKNENLKTIHTYTSDMADAVRMNEASVIKIALAEKDKREREAIYKEAGGTNTSKFFLAIGGILLIVASGFGLYYLMKKNDENKPVEQVIKNAEALISYDEKTYVDLTSTSNQSDIGEAIKDEMGKLGKPGSIKSIFLTTTENGTGEILSLSGLLSRLKTNMPGALVRALGDEYMMGVYTSNTMGGLPATNNLFLVFSIKDFNQAYAKMLEWEETLLRNTFILFDIDVTGSRNLLLEKGWKDIIINNRDARILYDEDGEDVLYYIFVDKSNLLITGSQEAMKEVILRLLAKSTKPL